MPPSDEVRGWSRLVAAVADRVIVGTVQDVHLAVVHGALRWAGPAGHPIARANAAATDRAYSAVRGALRVAGELGVAAADAIGTDDPLPSPAARKARAIAHGVVSDELMAEAPELDLELTLRHDGMEVATDPAALRATYADATGRITVFVHGLVDTEDVWFSSDEDGHAFPDIAAALGTTPLLVRYGSGRSIGRNGADLAELLERVVEGWPVPVDQLVVVGHSMGGLLARAACATAARRDHTWTAALTDVVYLGSPHLGSWLEKATNVVTWVIRRTSSHAAPIASLLDSRSRGIKDLRWGTLVDEGWGDDPIDDLLTGLVPDEPWLDDVTHHLVVGRLRGAERHLLNVTLGDALVRSRSASGVGRRRRIGEGGEVRTVPVGSSHSRLARAPQVGTMLEELLATS